MSKELNVVIKKKPSSKKDSYQDAANTVKIDLMTSKYWEKQQLCWLTAWPHSLMVWKCRRELRKILKSGKTISGTTTTCMEDYMKLSL